MSEENIKCQPIKIKFTVEFDIVVTDDTADREGIIDELNLTADHINDNTLSEICSKINYLYDNNAVVEDSLMLNLEIQ